MFNCTAAEMFAAVFDPFMIGQFYAALYAILTQCIDNRGRNREHCSSTVDTRAFNTWSIANVAASRSDTRLGGGRSGAPRTAMTRLHRFRLRTHRFSILLYDQPWFDEFPGHIHIDLMPEVQGGGWGRRLMEAYEERLKSLGCKGYHLGVGRRNERAVAFYRRCGMSELQAPAWGFVFGKKL